MRHDLSQLTDFLKNKNLSPKNFIEIGSRDARDADIIKNFWSMANEDCYVIEAHPFCYQNIVRDYPQFKTYNFAASNSDGIVEFHAGETNLDIHRIGMSSVLNRQINPHDLPYELVSVPAKRIDTFMAEHNIDHFDIVKIDVEGFAYQVLDGFGSNLNKCLAIQAELEKQAVWENQMLFDAVVSFLDMNGFDVLDRADTCEFQTNIVFINRGNL